MKNILNAIVPFMCIFFASCSKKNDKTIDATPMIKFNAGGVAMQYSGPGTRRFTVEWRIYFFG